MLNKNKKIIIVLAVILVLIVAALIATFLIMNKNKQNPEQVGEIKQAASLDDYIEADPTLLHKKNAKALNLPQKEIVPPVPTQIKIEKITMVPIMLVGGDTIYKAVIELPGNRFSQVEPSNLYKLFSVTTPEEALNYVDFLMVTAGRSSYDRARQTVWQESDYDKIGCKVMPEGQELPLPTDRPVSQTKVSGDGFEVTWVYSTPMLPAGYHKMVIQVEKNGVFTIKDNPEKPFWPCGEGAVF